MFLPLKSVFSLVLAATHFLVLVAAHPPSHRAKDKKGAVASESAVCCREGIKILEAGGNAADAMVATVFCIGVIGMYHSGFVLPLPQLPPSPSI